MTANGVQTLEQWPVDGLVPYARNARLHSDKQVAQLADSIRRFGFCNPILVADDGEIVAGHGRVLAAKMLGVRQVPVVVLRHLTPELRRAYRLADNRLAELGSWSDDLLARELAALTNDGVGIKGVGFTDKELGTLLAGLSTPSMEGVGADDPAEPATEEPAGEASPVPVTRPGDLWVLEGHRVICGDCQDADTVARLVDGPAVDMLLTDPPYCSGGFQEAAKRSGSIRAGRQGEVANDTLSSLGYQALIERALRTMPARLVNVFTDWRMWPQLLGMVEARGYAVRSMVIWDKDAIGPGHGWRGQHELVMVGVTRAYKFTLKAGRANVIRCKRSGNEFHPTEKPVPLLEDILKVSPDCAVVGDPFGGSGSTLIACARQGRAARLVELMPHHVDTTIRRWQAATGGEAVREADGRTFLELEAEAVEAAIRTAAQ